MSGANLIGQRFGRLTVTAAAPGLPKQRRWQCACDCGRTYVASTGRLHAGKTNSCGCLRREVAASALRTHGLSKTLTYRRWRAMMNRCTMVNAKAYPNYGGRGIKVCERWYAFEAYLADMGECPGPEWTVERIDSDGNYEPGNCRWATRLEQNRNTSRNLVIVFRGESRCASDWAELLGITVTTIYKRLARGWSPERALSTPQRRRQ